MKKLSFVFLAACLSSLSYAQTSWQQQIAYTIDVSLNEKEKSLDAFEKLVYTNNSPDTLHFIWFHLWPNAYKNDRTAFSDQLLENGNTRFYFENKDERGYINRLTFKVDGATAKTEDHPQHIDIIKLILPRPLPPNGSIAITTPFHVKLPFDVSRGGYDGQSIQATQWYPKPAVYDKNGWHEMPYLDQGEFYSEFGSYDVRITVPKNYVVAATGELQNAAEKEWLKSRTDELVPEVPKPLKQPINRKNTRTKNSSPRKSSPAPELTQSTKTLRYMQDNVHDFAWFADKNFLVNSDTLLLPSGHVVNVSSFYTRKEKALWQQSIASAKEALRFYSAEVGDYPYNVATVVQGPASFGGGMEYPTITLISPLQDTQELDATIAHELGHNWFYGMLASNERKHPWMDEGMNSFYENKYIERKYGRQEQWEEWYFQYKATRKTDQPIATSSEDFSATNYGLSAYHKTAEWMRELEKELGSEAFRQMMRRYFETWKMKHPQPEDFAEVARGYLGSKTPQLFAQLSAKGILPTNQWKGKTLLTPFQKNAIRNYMQSPTRTLLFLSPVAGYNVYDRLMPGAIFTNYASPTARLTFLAIPLYATGSKSLTGLAKINYARYSEGAIRKTDFFFNASSFHMDDFRDQTNETDLRMRFTRLVPGFRLTLREKNPRSTASRFLQWKTFLIGEQSLKVGVDSIFRPADTTVVYRYSTPRSSRYLNQLQLGYQNTRVLYPFDLTLQAEQAQDFVRTTFTGNYFFNYAKGGGLSVRLFAGKFSYLHGKTIQKQFNNDRYALNLTGPNGYEDYTYSDYFLGRNRFDGLPSQQLMIRDGAFKVRTDLLANKVGKTDNWLAAVNFVTTVPAKLNPLSVLPVQIPLRIFADVGTYAEAWDRANDADRFLFDAGLQVSLLHETVNLYVPLLYSRVYSTYFKSTITHNRFLKTISFSIDINNKTLKKLKQEGDF
ncbi:M1 family metallopeptidase [Flavisolibacter nicotianae]|uniref:M1 family metallopeptidase n=1 Tax=Flavisolibacter nicotianae TaxID=2364882 RepID=UPI000EB4D9AC|nr:M1 family metallopeptidase [Flavisolibacter nicotianae]